MNDQAFVQSKEMFSRVMKISPEVDRAFWNGSLPPEGFAVYIRY